MSATILDGKKLAADMRADIANQVAKLKVASGVTPGLGVILIGLDPASTSYVTAKEKACEEAGMYSQDVRVPAETTQAEALALVQQMNADPRIHGILVQLPLPKHINESAVINAIAPEKDVDGFTPVNVGRMMIGETCYLPCTPHGIIQMLLKAGVTSVTDCQVTRREMETYLLARDDGRLQLRASMLTLSTLLEAVERAD